MRFRWLIFLLAAGCVSATRPVPPCSAVAVPAAPAARPIAPPVEVAGQQVRVANGSILSGDQVVAGPFLAIDSFDVSQSRREIVFSAKRKDSFDIGLVAVEGSAIKWVPEDPADEVAVRWAPRGNKISYIVRAMGGDLVRTVHIPTAMDLVVVFPWARITDLVWDAAAEKYTVTYSTPDATERREVARYGGEERAVVSPPASRLDVTIEPLGADAIVLRPNDIRYDERLPVVIWIETDLYAWSAQRAALVNGARVALVVAKSADVALGEGWMDPSRVFTVGARRAEGMSIVADPAIPSGRYRAEGRVVSVDPALVQSFAACFIADELKRTSPTNGSSR